MGANQSAEGKSSAMPQPKKVQKPAHTALSLVELLSQDASGAPAVPPKEFRIFPAGAVESHKGTFQFTEASATKVMARAEKYGNDFSIDYQHGMFNILSADPSESAKAAGWFKPEVRNGELWATDVSWTPKAAQMLSNREYRYISPAFDHNPDSGEVAMLRNVALTNIPAIYDLEPLLASWAGATTEADDETKEEPPTMKTLLALLGLAESASEAEGMAKLSQITQPVTELLSITGKASAMEALGVVKAWKQASDSVPAMHAELSQLKTAATDGKRDQLLAEGKRRGVIPPAYEPVLKTMELSQLEAFLKVAVPVVTKEKQEPLTVTQKEIDGKTVTLSQEENQVAAMLGISSDVYAKRKLARGGAVPVSDPATKSKDA